MQGRAAKPINIPMYIDGGSKSKDTYSFGGGDITGIPDQTWNNLPIGLTTRKSGLRMARQWKPIPSAITMKLAEYFITR